MTQPSTYSDAVRNLQRYLRRLSYEDNDILPIPIDGIFAERTEEALLEFQQAYGLPVTGRADRETWDLLFLEYLRLSEEADTVEAIDLFPKKPANYVTQPGERSAFVAILQWMLGELTVVYDDLPTLSVNGHYDEKTIEAVRKFQQIHALPTTGLLNRATWNRIAKEYEFWAA